MRSRAPHDKIVIKNWKRFVRNQCGGIVGYMLKENVDKIVKYCRQYQSHGYMMDERNLNAGFNVELPEENFIRRNIEKLRLILFTGEAGDGKTRIMRNLKEIFAEHGFRNLCVDFSALAEADKELMIERIRNILSKETGDKLVIAANIGAFTQAVLKFDLTLMEELTRKREDVYLCNFENRNLAEDAEVFRRIIEEFLKSGGEESIHCTERSCIHYDRCCFRENIRMILSDSGREALRAVCNAIYLTGGHLTFRELLSLLSYIVTFGQDCEERRRYLAEGGEEEKIKYYQIFEPKADALLEKVSRMDPALKKGVCPQSIDTKEKYINYRRKSYFEAPEEKYYEMLNVDYLVPFAQVLKYINTPPYYYDTVQDKNPTLQSLKRGINKMSSQGKSDTGLVITDTPVILGSQIRTEFMVMQDINMIWHKYDIGDGKEDQGTGKFWNKFYLSYRSPRNRRLISLLIDYQQFRYLMLCSEDYFVNGNELTVEEHAVNIFYRKILQEREQVYDSIVIRFDNKEDGVCDFSLTVHESEDFFSGEKTQSIRIRRED